MPLSVCPTATCHAPASAVWSLLADPATYGTWADAIVECLTPPGRAAAGQTIRLRAPTWARLFTIDLVIDRVDASTHVLELHGKFPFGLRMQNRFAVTPIDAQTCRIQFG